MKKTISTKTEKAGLTFKSIFKDSDRGCILSVGAILDKQLELIHHGHIAFSTNRDQRIFKKLNSPYAPLGNFAGKIQIAFAYGLIDKATFDDLEIIRQLRNEAAHCMFDFSLENAGIVRVVNKLTALARSRHSKIRTGAEGIESTINSSVKGAAKQRFLANGFALHLILMYLVVQHADRLLEKEKRKHLP